MRPIAELWNRHAGEMAWVIAAGASAGFVDPAFFHGKLAIGVNRVWKRFPVSYCVFKEQYAAKEAWEAGVRVIVSRHHCGNAEFAENYLRGAYVFDHEENHLGEVNVEAIAPPPTPPHSANGERGEGKIVVSWSTITSAMHIAAHLGAREILLVGHDCGKIDGEANYAGYGDPLMGIEKYKQWIGEIEPQTLAVKQKLEEVYGCRIYSLNPWVNFGLEGHRYER